VLVKSIAVEHFGPFAFPSTLHVDPRVTVITGPNDTGKSILLRAIQLAFAGGPCSHDEINQERAEAFAGPSQNIPDVRVTVEIEVTQESIAKGAVAHPKAQPGDILTFARRLNQGSTLDFKRWARGDREMNGILVRGMPEVIVAPPDLTIRDAVPLQRATELELRLLKLGFGVGFTADQFASASLSARDIRTQRAQDALNQRLRNVFPGGLPLEFRLRETDLGEQGRGMAISLVDPVRCFVPVGQRGTGVRKLLALMALLLERPDSPEAGKFKIILLDEPENSLHADAQHSLRRLLERLADSPLAQVIYATHSPAMINNMRPGAIRVVERKEQDGRPTSVVHNQAFRDNFHRVRSSLGITPADSLLFAPVTVIVEGPTEARCIPLLLEKLQRAGVAGFEDASDILSQSHFVDGTGDSYEYMVRVAKSHKVKPIVFLDGDKQRSAAKVGAAHPDVAIVMLPPQKEFEDLVPFDVYLAAAAKVVEGAPEPADARRSFDAWLATSNQRPEWLTSKRVERWLDDEAPGAALYKHLAMEQAANDVDAAQIDAEPLRKLLAVMRQTLADCG
jgi:ABC-type transport system involved in cytochrome c biogenesis ATPase subunit